jgi:hypothetical protein
MDLDLEMAARPQHRTHDGQMLGQTRGGLAGKWGATSMLPAYLEPRTCTRPTREHTLFILIPIASAVSSFVYMCEG